MGSLLHDIGKIGVRDAVLLKPGPLNQDEWSEMREHPRLGWALLQRIEFLRDASIIVLQHQERFDGKGYPRGLRGNEIPLGARIFAIADTLDAMTSDRPYRKGTSFAAAREEIARCSGGQFDPSIVDVFLDIPADSWTGLRAEIGRLSPAALSSTLCRPEVASSRQRA
jgi:HD-GYP domain-containing protein (c-di-GMP phosphodiesterase class II)